MHHKTKHIEYTDKDGHKREDDVDELIAPLVLNLWKLDIFCSGGCQNVHGNVSLEFSTAMDAEMFLNAAAEYNRDEESMYQRMGGTIFEGCGDEHWNWHYECFIKDYGVSYPNLDEEPEPEDLVEEFEGKHTFIFSMRVFFPLEDLANVEKRIEKALNGQTTQQKQLN